MGHDQRGRRGLGISVGQVFDFVDNHRFHGFE
jgi:hypothetical protein